MCKGNEEKGVEVNHFRPSHSWDTEGPLRKQKFYHVGDSKGFIKEFYKVGKTHGIFAFGGLASFDRKNESILFTRINKISLF